VADNQPSITITVSDGSKEHEVFILTRGSFSLVMLPRDFPIFYGETSGGLQDFRSPFLDLLQQLETVLFIKITSVQSLESIFKEKSPRRVTEKAGAFRFYLEQLNPKALLIIHEPKEKAATTLEVSAKLEFPAPPGPPEELEVVYEVPKTTAG
jgi:hypothetical protein